MKSRSILSLALFLVTALCALPVLAAPDQYPGDSSIYGVQAPLQPNVLIFIDNSGSMADLIPGASYTPSTTYAASNVCTDSTGHRNQPCASNAVYSVTTSTDSYGNVSLTGSSFVNASYTNVVTSCAYHNPENLLATTGQYSGRSLLSGGTVCDSNRYDTGMYYTGNYINYLYTPASDSLPKYVIAQNVVKNLITSSNNVKFGLMTFYYPGYPYNGYTPRGATFLSVAPPWTSTKYTTIIQKMGSSFPSGSTYTNRDALVNAVNGITPIGSTGLGMALYEIGQYYNSAKPAYGATLGVSGGVYSPSPIDAPCQNNYVIFVTDGASNSDVNSSVISNNLSNICPTSPCPSSTPFDPRNADCCPVNDIGGGSNGLDNSLADVARTLNVGPQSIVTYTVGFGLAGADLSAVNLLKQAADVNHGKGQSFMVGTQASLSLAFSQIMSNIYSINSSYVAPVVPVSPQNRTYGASRVYMGFFKPNNNSYWYGNLKKLGVDPNNNITDANGNFATWVDINPADGKDDLTLATLPSGAVNGSFKSTAQSFWSTSTDAGSVNAGGAGGVLESLSAPITSPTRNLYTAVGGSTVAFNTTNVSAAALGYNSGNSGTDSANATNLVNFLYGQDAYNSSGPTQNRPWIMGDILHSRPMVINYKSYLFNSANETSCSVNKTMIFVGGNDGMLHAIRDCDGSEAWAFIPPDMLGNLQYINGVNHTYFVDSTVSAYVYNKANDGNIVPANGDKVILMFGERRGGGVASAPTTGYYYALDVSDLTKPPSYLWSLSNSTPTSGGAPLFPELGESWSEPKIVKIKSGSPVADRIVAFFGAGYDNANEDGRYGANQLFTGTGGGAAASSTGQGNATNPASGTGYSPVSPTGRGIYAVELATLNSLGVPTVDSSVNKIWSYTNANSSAMAYSFPGQLAAIDSKNTGYTDRLYGADTGGNLWRFDVGSSSTSNWKATRIFSANPGSGGGTDTGRKIFYTPSVTLETGATPYAMLFFGTGDREHPLNTAITDRIYAVKDPLDVSYGSPAPTPPLTESNLLDVTSDQLQTSTVANPLPGSVSDILNQLNGVSAMSNSNKAYGWYIQLNQFDPSGQKAGEKVLASPMIFNKTAFFSSYLPNQSTGANACSANLGTALQYALNYKTGEAVLNYDSSNDNTKTSNLRALGIGGVILQRSDRVQTVGTGIPSGLVILIDPNGKLKSLTGVGGAIAGGNPPPGGSIIPLYWRMK